jgi:hypothetical protein
MNNEKKRKEMGRCIFVLYEGRALQHFHPPPPSSLPNLFNDRTLFFLSFIESESSRVGKVSGRMLSKSEKVK